MVEMKKATGGFLKALTEVCRQTGGEFTSGG
jgi:hypothetical protein